MEYSSISAKDFQVEKQLGSGSFGKVQLVRKFGDQKLYAMKSVLLSRLTQKEKDNALNEVRLLASIRIPYVISYKGAFYNHETHCLCVVMEYAEGGDLQHKIIQRINNNNGQGFQQNYIWKVAYQILKGLHKLHEHKIVHRDIKAANIFFANDIAKLGDLNVSKVIQQGWCQTQTGTPYYTSPQIWNGKRYSSKCDIWSLGCLIYEMCTLKPPFRATDLPSLFRKVVVGEYQQIPSKYSQQLKDILRQCLTVDDQIRPSAADLLDSNILSGMEMSLEAFRHQQQQIELIDPIKCPRVLKFLNNRLPKTQFEASIKKNVGFVTKKQIQKQGIKQKQSRSLRKILSQKIIQIDHEDNSKLQKQGSKKNIKLPPLQKDYPSQPLTFTLKKMKTNSSKLKLQEKQNRSKIQMH